jgi:putative DNA primase/helicase
MLLADIQQVFATRRANKLFTVSLIEALCAMPERPWLEANKCRRIDANWLARSLRNYRIKPNTIRIGRTLQKGYRAADFRDAFERYVPQLGLPSRNTVTRAEYIADYQI